MQAYQFKVFPVGVDKGKIITIDFILHRTGIEVLSISPDSDLSNYNWLGERWEIESYISVYDKHQQLTSKQALDSTYSEVFSYFDTLNSIFLRGYNHIKATYPKIDLFKPEYLSFCDFQEECHLVKKLNDTVSHKNYIIYKNKNYEVPIISDSTYYGLSYEEHQRFGDISNFYFNSIRILKSKKMTLLIVHLTENQVVGMEHFTTDPEEAGETEDGFITLLKEYEPDFPFTDLKHSTYEEPVPYHGYGFDVFVVE